jgi:hypothetical protein
MERHPKSEKKASFFFGDDFELVFSRLPGSKGEVRVLLSFPAGL